MKRRANTWTNLALLKHATPTIGFGRPPDEELRQCQTPCYRAGCSNTTWWLLKLSSFFLMVDAVKLTHEITCRSMRFRDEINSFTAFHLTVDTHQVRAAAHSTSRVYLLLFNSILMEAKWKWWVISNVSASASMLKLSILNVLGHDLAQDSETINFGLLLAWSLSDL